MPSELAWLQAIVQLRPSDLPSLDAVLGAWLRGDTLSKTALSDIAECISELLPLAEWYEEHPDAEHWATHCWARGNPLRSLYDYSPRCDALATHRGPPNSPSAFRRAWRSCDKHQLRGDVPFGIQAEGPPGGNEGVFISADA